MSFGAFGDFLRGLDRWVEREDEHGDPGRGGRMKPVILRCDCGWQGDWSAAVGHYRQTGHSARYKGNEQDFSKFAVTADELEMRR